MALPIPVSTDVGASGDPNVTSAPPASTDTSPATPIDTSAVQPAPDVQAPPSDAASVGAVTGADQQPTQPDQNFWGDAAPAAATLAKQGRLAGLLRGVLMGLENGHSPVSAVIGGVEGAAAPNMVSQRFAEQQQLHQAAFQSKLSGLQFESARAALGILQAGRDRQMLDNLPDPLVEMHDQAAQSQVQALIKAGAKPIVVPDAPGAGQAVLRELQTRYGKVPFFSTIHQGGNLYVFPVGGTGNDYESYVALAKQSGQDPVTRDVWDGLKPDKQAEALHTVQSFWSSVPDAEHLDQTIQQTKLARATYNANTPAWNSDKATILKRYDDRLAFLNQTSNFYDARERQYLAQKEAVKQQAAQQVAHSGQDENGQWDPSSIPVMLVEGRMDPSQLSKRVSKGYSMNDVLSAADRYSRATYGQPFDVAQATSDYKYATNNNTQNTLKYLNSLTGSDNQSGNLGALVDLSNKIPRTQLPAINNTEAWAKLQAGDPQMTAYYSAVTEVSDQVAKIMQGGSGSSTSDAKLRQAQELFNKGFTPQQIASTAVTLRTLLANRKNELIGDNRYLRNQYLHQPVAQQKPAAPAAPQQQAANTPGAPAAGGFFSKIPGAKVRQ